MIDGLGVRSLEPADAPLVADLLARQPAGYLDHFHPFAFDVNTLGQVLKGRRRDVFLGIWWEGRLVSFFMLRGFDAGYQTPSYGVMVDAEVRGFGLGRLTLQLSKSICRLMRVGRLMLKVHPDNEAARRLYESEAFVQTGLDLRNGHVIYETSLNAPGQRSSGAGASDR